MNQIHKYPRTKHLQDSKYQNGDFDMEAVPFGQLEGKYLVVEEKMDGANSGISFIDGEIKLQSRGHYLTGGYRERHFSIFKAWANYNYMNLFQLLGEKYVMYGEWLYAKHTVYYNNLPNYFMEFDILDTENMTFLSTERRKNMLKSYGFISSVRVIDEGRMSFDELKSHSNQRSNFITNYHIEELKERINERKDLDWRQVVDETDKTDLMEGLYIKWEEDGIVKGRYKYVRKSFLDRVVESESHWIDRPIIPNMIQGANS